MKRWWGIVCICLLLLTGCFSVMTVVQNETPESDTQSQQQNQPEKLVLWSYYETQAQKENLNSLIVGFNRSQEQYEARWEYYPMSDFTKKLSIGLTLDTLPDLVIIDNPDMTSYIKQGLFEDITAYMQDLEGKDLYYSGAMSSTTYEGKNYGIPFSTNSVALIYNTDMLAEAGVTPPQTWNEFLTAAQKLTTDTRKGFGMAMMKSEQATFQFLPWLFSTGVRLEDIGSEGSIRAFELISKLVADGSLSRECINWSQVDVGRKFIAGEIAMMENGPWVLPAMEEHPDLHWDIVKLPIDKTVSAVIGGENLGVVKGKNIKGAVEFLKYCSRADIVEQSAVTAGAIPPRKDVAQKAQWSENPAFQVFVEQMEYAVPRGKYVNWIRISDVISSELQIMVIGEQTAEQAAKNAQGKIAEFLL